MQVHAGACRSMHVHACTNRKGVHLRLNLLSFFEPAPLPHRHPPARPLTLIRNCGARGMYFSGGRFKVQVLSPISYRLSPIEAAREGQDPKVKQEVKLQAEHPLAQPVAISH